MEIIVGKTAGFCFGVANAVNETKKVLKKEETYCLGELVHNTQVMEELKKEGLHVIENIEQVHTIPSIIIIRAHGITKNMYENLKNKNFPYVDLTCPKVLAIHEKVQNYAKQNYYIFLIGKKEHPETIGTISFCGENARIIEKEEEIEEAINKFKTSTKHKAVALVQTTFSLDKFYQITEKLKKKLPKESILQIENTICPSTKQRQEETVRIAKQIEAMIIIGGKHSSNTRKLYEIAKQNTNIVFWIESMKECPWEKIKAAKKIGIMAGASTPIEYVQEVVKRLEKG